MVSDMNGEQGGCPECSEGWEGWGGQKMLPRGGGICTDLKGWVAFNWQSWGHLRQRAAGAKTEVGGNGASGVEAESK